MDHEFHEIARAFPMYKPDRLEELARDIEEKGLYRPIVLFEGKILDGRNRYLACEKAGYQADYLEFEGDWDAAVAWVESENLKRRDLTNYERSMAAGKIASLKSGRPKKYDGEKTPPIGGVSAADAADRYGVSQRSVERAKRIHEQGDDSLVEAVEAGEVSLGAAAAVASLPKQQQKEIVEQGPEVVKQAAEKVRKKEPVTTKVDSEEIRAEQAAAKQVADLVSVRKVLARVLDILGDAKFALNPKQTAQAVAALDEIRKTEMLLRGKLVADLPGMQSWVTPSDA